MTDGQWARGGPDEFDDEIDVFATGATITRQFDVDQHVVADLLRRGGATLQEGYEHARELQARPGPRPGVQPAGAASRRRGDSCDIVRPVAVNPTIASACAITGSLFRLAVPHLDVDHAAHRPDDDRYLTWHSTVTHGRGRGVPATLHLLASPSMVVTVLELVPQRRLRWHRRRFLRDGIAALDALAARLERPGLSAQ